jgi:hypothetical protein
MKRFVVRTGLEPVTTSGMGLLTANEIAVSRIQLLAIASTIPPPDYINISSSTFYSQHRGIVYNLARLTAVWELKFTNVNDAGHA